MKLTTLADVYDALRELKNPVTVPAEVAGRARQSLERMLAVSPT